MPKCAILCDKCLNINLDKLAQKIDADVIKVHTCEDELDVDVRYHYVIFGCPALYHSSDYPGMYDIVDLRLIEGVFKKPEKVAADWINSSLVSIVPPTRAVETTDDVIYWGNNLDVIEELSRCTNLTVVADRQTAKKLYPFHFRVLEVNDGQAVVTGEVGNFEMVVKGYDPIKGKSGNFTLRAGQLVVPEGLADDREGIFSYGDTSQEYRAALKLINNLGGYAKINPVHIRYDMCATSKSGIAGCELCFSCPQGAVTRVREKISISDSCNGCGFCAAVCPLSVMDNTLLPSYKLLEKINAVAGENKTVAFICEGSLGDLYELKGGKKLAEISPIVVPCINAISEVHYLYTVLKGANVVVIPCEEEHNFKCYELAKQTLDAFGFDCLRTSSFEELNKSKIKGKNPGDIMVDLVGENKREQWLNLVKKLREYYPVKKAVFDSDLFATVGINDNCTLCMTCTHFCPTGAIRREEDSIYFDHGLCIACNLCTACPEEAINIERVLDFNQLGEKEIFKDEILSCPSCGKPHISRGMYEKLSAVGEHSLLFCSECRPKIILESIYEEIMNEKREHGEKNE
ncbi:MAG: 4Fe-4S binding protein [Archaeoglobaceae archaeon]